MIESIETIRQQFEQDLASAGDNDALEEIRIQYLGRKNGVVTEAVKKISTVPAEQKGEYGKSVNILKKDISAALEQKAEDLKSQQSAKPAIDVTLPGRRPRTGLRHPVTVVRRRIVSIFKELGYAVKSGPQIEDDFHNFQALNMPEHHPARDTQDTFYIDGGWVLRTHTSPVQIRTMENGKPPIKIITPGRVYRKDYDITHTPMFSQVEGLVVDRHITFGDLKGTLEYFVQRMYGKDTRARFRPSFFPFTEPSAEVDISCPFCGGEGCRVCKNSGWIEIMGCGMVNPAVFENVGIDPEEYRGFAFGMGIERQVILKYGVDDSRLLFENDMRLLDTIGGWQ